MRKIIAVALFLAGMASFAQEKVSKEDVKAQKSEMERLSPEQRNQLRLKELTLELDLTTSQQKEMAKIIAEQEVRREAMKAEMKAKKETGKKPTSDELFVMKNKRLDEEIALKQKVKKVLTPEQLEKWEKMKKHKRADFKKDIRKRHEKKLEQK